MAMEGSNAVRGAAGNCVGVHTGAAVKGMELQLRDTQRDTLQASSICLLLLAV